MIAPFVDVPTLVTTYKIAGTIPVLLSVAQYPMLFNFLKSNIKEDWSTKTRIANYVRANEVSSHQYRITLIHAEDDYDIPLHHTPTLLNHAASATSSHEIGQDDVAEWKSNQGQAIGHAGHEANWRTHHGVISEYLLKYGLHDVVMGAPIVTLAAMRIFDGANVSSG